jgi:hypothetical protein
MKWVIEQLKQPSTWRGITMLVTSLGIVIHPELMEQIIASGTAVAGLIGVLFKG